MFFCPFSFLPTICTTHLATPLFAVSLLHNCKFFLIPVLYDAPFLAGVLATHYGEFAIIKIWVVYLFPDTKKFNGISVPQPIRDKKIAILCFQHIGQRDVVLIIESGDRNFCSIDDQLVLHPPYHPFCDSIAENRRPVEPKDHLFF